MNKYNVIIVGAGPAGIFTAVQLVKNNYQGSILMIEKGKDILNRRCPKHKLGHCVKCEPCAITTGFSGAGAFSDGKLSLSPEVGGDLPELIGYDTVEELIKYADDIYLEFGADERIEGLGSDEAIQNIRKRAIHADLKLVDCPIRHLGTEKAQEVYGRLQSYLIDKGVEIRFNTSVENIDTYDLDGGPTDYCTGVWVRPNNKVNPEYIRGDHIIIAAGRRGAEWLFNVCNNHNIEHIPGTVDIGVRVECRNEVMEEINKALYEGKLIGYPQP
ncbi:MAG: FAD-dependent oxidoreductase, partial [Bacteroidaceae bacterium]|nr:FAD-dependent oxidoreductase [Bacteroidaceae bacterium]